VALDRSESREVREARAWAVRDLPHLVDLLAATLRSGAAPVTALATVCAACPGAAADRLDPVLARLRVGVPAGEVWRVLSRDDVLAPLGHTLARAEASGSSVADAIERLADDLEREALATVEDRARAVGVRAAVPLGLCLLPAFILVGIVPTVAGLLATLRPTP
jgi:pilus assembly protein TadC